MEQSFKSTLPISDVVVWYYGQTKDQYGNGKEDIIISYAITKSTALKINWGGFDKNGLCDFLKTQSDEDVCVIKVNIQ